MATNDGDAVESTVCIEGGIMVGESVTTLFVREGSLLDRALLGSGEVDGSGEGREVGREG